MMAIDFDAWRIPSTVTPPAVVQVLVLPSLRDLGASTAMAFTTESGTPC